MNQMLSPLPSSSPTAKVESIDSILAKNLVAARIIAGVTQQALANSARVSRATVAQLETGCSDPRLSTVVDLAEALGLPPMVLLAGIREVRLLAALAQGIENPLTISATDRTRLHEYVASGMLKDRVRAARLGANLAREKPQDDPCIAIIAGLFSATLPAEGTIAGAQVGRLLEQFKIA
jgi:DNA-binding XRE family transcriptional regulator